MKPEDILNFRWDERQDLNVLATETTCKYWPSILSKQFNCGHNISPFFHFGGYMFLRGFVISISDHERRSA